MLYIVTLTYLRPIEEINCHLEAHRKWLEGRYREGRFLLSGPLVPRTGGLILARSQSREALDAMLASDPFALHGLAAYDVMTVNPSMRATDFPAAWAPTAKTLEDSQIQSDEAR